MIGFMVLLILAVLGPRPLHAHGTVLLGGSLRVSEDGSVVLWLEIPPPRLALFTGDLSDSIRTWGDVRSRQDAIAKCFTESILLRSRGREWVPVRCGVPPLQGQYPPGDAMNLPDFVPVAVVWREVPAGPLAVVPRFNLGVANIVLVLSGGVAAEVDNGLALRDPSAATVLPKTEPSTSVGRVTAAVDTSGGFNVPVVSEPLLRTLLRALVIGVQHIIPEGTDHILFVLGLYLASRRWREVFTQVTAFTVAHCLTLGLAMSGMIVINAGWAKAVEVCIALSIVAVAVENCWQRKPPSWSRLVMVAVLGLVHGLGFSGALAEVHWPEGRFLPALLAANVGIEVGQLLVISAAAVMTAWWWSRDWYRRRIVIPLSVSIGLCGLAWTIQRMSSS